MIKNRSYEKVKNFWLKSAQDNFQIAKTMLKTGRYNFAMFMCQQSLEALLKAIVIIKTKGRPPYIHELGILLKAARLRVPRKILEILKEADKHYIKTRYKEDRFNTKIYNKDTANKLIEKTHRVMKWFIKKVNLNL